MTETLKCPICGQPTRVYMGNARKVNYVLSMLMN